MKRVWRAKLFTEELTSCGFHQADPEQRWVIIRGLLKAKGVPEEYFAPGAPIKTEEEDDGILLELG